MKPTWKTRIVSLLKIAGMILAIFLIVVLVIFSIWQASFVSWTGFGNFTTPTGEFIRGKTLWDWMELLVIPITLLIGGFVLNRSERDVERKLANDRAELEREIAKDRQYEAALQNYIDRISELLLNEKLRTTRKSEVRDIARTRTLTVLRGIDKRRKSVVIRFLYEAGLIENENKIVDLNDAFLFGLDMRNEYLSEVNLSNTTLSRAMFFLTDLSGADLSGASLFHAYLRGSNLECANLIDADLTNADLTDACLIGADLTNATLRDALLTKEQLATVKSLKGATMPDGTIHD